MLDVDDGVDDELNVVGCFVVDKVVNNGVVNFDIWVVDKGVNSCVVDVAVGSCVVDEVVISGVADIGINVGNTSGNPADIIVDSIGNLVIIDFTGIGVVNTAI